jgi:hypothetical protein
MGCDIHMFVEYRQRMQGYDSWRSWGDRTNPGRNYELFGLLAGVRSDGDEQMVPSRGMPDDASFMATHANQMFITTEGEGRCTLEQARHYETLGSTIIEQDGKPTWVTHPDWHSHSWCTTTELDACLKRVHKLTGAWAMEYHALLAAMQKLEHYGCEVRCVFWFDN